MKTGQILAGVFVGVGAIASAPYTGGASLFAGTSLAASLKGAIGPKEMKEQALRRENQFKKGWRNGKISTKEKFPSLLKTQKDRDEIMIISIKVGVFLINEYKQNKEEELEDLKKLIFFIDENPTTPMAIKEIINNILSSEITFDELIGDVKLYLNDKNAEEKIKIDMFFENLVKLSIKSDGQFNKREREFIEKWKIEIK